MHEFTLDVGLQINAYQITIDYFYNLGLSSETFFFAWIPVTVVIRFRCKVSKGTPTPMDTIKNILS